VLRYCLFVGKNFSGNNVNGKRRAADFYETPYSMTRQLLDREPFPSEVLEPACGGGAIVRVLNEAGHTVTAYDRETCFLQESRRFESILTNPPFSKAFEFILQAKRCAGSKFAFLLPLSYLHGKQRYDAIYTESTFPLARVHVFVRYPMLGEPLRQDGRYRTGMMVYAWYVWDRNHVGPPVLSWIDNQAFVAGARERDQAPR
jgi:hypothetical protein